MTFNELVTKVRNMAAQVDVSNRDFLAVQINITGKDPGVFYVEVKDHRINVEPYDYHDRNCAITINMTNFNKLIDGKLTLIEIAPGIDLEKDILANMDFKPEIAKDLKVMDEGMFRETWGGLTLE